MLLKEFSNVESLLKIFTPLNEWKPFPRAEDRLSWDELSTIPLNELRKNYFMEQAEKYHHQDWPVLPAHLFMDYVLNGNRTRYQNVYFSRRARFSDLVLAECFEHKGRFIHDIINGFWAILEETTWCLPSHYGKREGDPLPELDKHIPDLFACQTAIILAEAYYLLQNDLYSISPNLCLRIKTEIKRRVLTPFINSSYSGWEAGKNNWSIWCASNILGASMYILDDLRELATISLKLFAVFERYYENYSEDGGCDEGSSYWRHSPGYMTIFLELLRDRSNGMINLYDDEKIKKMAYFIVDAHIHKNYFINFADADANPKLDFGITYRLGEMTGQQEICNFIYLRTMGWDVASPIDEIPVYDHGSKVVGLTYRLRDLFWFQPRENTKSLSKKLSTWYPKIELLLCRQTSQSDKGFFCAIKGGHNGENHNHNDVGHFILYSDGRPCVLDVGVESYNSDTFSENRYNLTYISSAGHNVPIINGAKQLTGKDYGARNVEYKSAKILTTLKMNIEEVYSECSRLISYERKLDFNYDKSEVLVSDQLIFNQSNNKIEYNFYTQSKPKLESSNKVLLLEEPDVWISCNQPSMTYEINEILIEDVKLLKSWVSPIYRITASLEINQKDCLIQHKFNS